MTNYKSEWQEIHMQIDAIVRAIPEHFLLDPPDGGDVTVAEGVQRMAARIEQLEAAMRYYACKCKNPHTGCAVEFERSGNARCGWEARAALEGK